MHKKKKSYFGDRNYYICGDGAAYTDDLVEVYNIFLYQISCKIKPDDINKYFSNFGKIRRMRTVLEKKCARRRKIGALRVAFVEFIYHMAAAEVLKKSKHRIVGKYGLSVKACESWYQPNFSTKQLNLFNNKFESSPIFVLNDDCLINILKRLDLKDQIRCSRTCKRFHDVLSLISKTKYKCLDVNDLKDLKLSEIITFLQYSKNSIESLNYKPNGQTIQDIYRVLDLITVHTSCLTSINLWGFLVKTVVLKKFLKSARFIKLLSLKECSLNEEALISISRLSRLETLILNDNINLLGKYLGRFKSIKHLSLNSCKNIQSKYFIELVKENPHLRSLDIRHCPRLDGISYEALAENSKQLETLQISATATNYVSIAKLENLKHLIILDLYDSPMCAELYSELARQKSCKLLECLDIDARNWITPNIATNISKLENLKKLVCKENLLLTDEILMLLAELKNLYELDISCCPNFTQEGLLCILKSCKKLKVINVQHCTQISNDVILKIAENLKRNKCRTKPCKFFVAGSGVTKHILDHLNCIDAKSFIALDFTMINVVTKIAERNDFYDEMLDNRFDDIYEDVLDDLYDENDDESFSSYDDSEQDFYPDYDLSDGELQDFGEYY